MKIPNLKIEKIISKQKRKWNDDDWIKSFDEGSIPEELDYDECIAAIKSFESIK